MEIDNIRSFINKKMAIPPTPGDTEANYNFNMGYDLAVREINWFINQYGKETNMENKQGGVNNNSETTTKD